MPVSATVNTSGRTSDVFAARSAGLPVAGRIRPGVQVLTKAAREQIPNAEQIYRDGIEAGAAFEDIEARLRNAAPKTFKRRPLTPRNVPHFRVSQSDFTTPGAAEKILGEYGEDRGDGVQLYSFPVVFPLDDIGAVFREQFEAWTSRELAFWSEYTPSGDLHCHRRAPIDKQAKRRRFGGRPVEDLGPCDPNACDEFAQERCNHHAALYFYVPGVPGVGLVELPFTSIYASMGIRQMLEMVKGGLGRIQGVHNGQPIFWLTKKAKNVSRIDWEKGEATRTDQYIIEIEARGLDMTQVFVQQERQALGLPPAASGGQSRAAGAVPALEGPRESVIEPEPESVEPEPEQAVEPTDETKAAIADARKVVFGVAEQHLGLSKEQFGAWGQGKYGEAAFRQLETLQQIEEDVAKAMETGDVSEFAKGEGAPF